MKKGTLFGLILLGAALLYLVGLKYGLPYVFQLDEPITVRRALRFGSGDLNPHFYYPSLLMYVYFLLYGIYYLLGHLAGFFPDTQSFAHAFISDPSVFYLIGRAVSALSLLGGLVVLYRCGEKWGGRGPACGRSCRWPTSSSAVSGGWGGDACGARASGCPL